LMIRSIIAIQTIEPGFDPNNLLTARLTLPQRDYPTASQQSEFFTQLMTRIIAQPGIKSAGAINSLPLIGGNNAPTHSLAIEGRPPEANGQSPWARVLITAPDCFTALGIPLFSGRPLLAQDTVNAPPVALINLAMAQKYWPQADPLGRRIKIDEASQTDLISIVGIVGDVREDYADAPPAPRIYLPYAQHPVGDMFLVIRTADAQVSAAQMLRNTVRTIDRNLPLYEIHSMRQRLFNDLSSTYLLVELLGMFALAALFLASVGLYGIVAYSVSQRTREIGIRMALGAQSGEVLKLILRQGMKLTAVGLLIGLAAAFGMTWLMKRILFAVSVVDPSTFALIAVLLTVVSLLACWIPARRATKVNPLTALR
jgi:putative ABC transport system permease protein